MTITTQTTGGVIEARREDLLRWIGVGGVVGLLFCGGLLNGHTGLLDAAWQILMGGSVGWAYAIRYGPLAGALERDPAQELRGSREGFWEGLVGWLTGTQDEHLEVPVGTVLVSACLVPMMVELITPVSDYGNSALLALWATTMGGCTGGGLQLWRDISKRGDGDRGIGAGKRPNDGGHPLKRKRPDVGEVADTENRNDGSSRTRVASVWTGSTGHG